ncbi:hypothetical protein U5801_24850 [Lamprobacter modestohalophilus]|uniref:hypothetical protein n=1 Tax=Lamprobacter modestohalophilus TaxID=1064514 RepID=UPI002ADEEB83|nr:hypothetical protein [Lamprobacter modestohalophilus]MEA1053012.1 hypothetical protein [Lamprobacter modestohalophilus]
MQIRAIEGEGLCTRAVRDILGIEGQATQFCGRDVDVFDVLNARCRRDIRGRGEVQNVIIGGGLVDDDIAVLVGRLRAVNRVVVRRTDDRINTSSERPSLGSSQPTDSIDLSTLSKAPSWRFPPDFHPSPCWPAPLAIAS